MASAAPIRCSIFEGLSELQAILSIFSSGPGGRRPYDSGILNDDTQRSDHHSRSTPA